MHTEKVSQDRMEWQFDTSELTIPFSVLHISQRDLNASILYSQLRVFYKDLNGKYDPDFPATTFHSHRANIQQANLSSPEEASEGYFDLSGTYYSIFVASIKHKAANDLSV